MIGIFSGRKLDSDEKGVFMQVQVDLREHLHLFSTGKSGSALMVFMAIALHSNEDGWAWPGRKLISQETGLCYNTVSTCLVHLRKMRINGKRVLSHYREKHPITQAWGRSAYLIFPDVRHGPPPFENLELWDPQEGEPEPEEDYDEAIPKDQGMGPETTYVEAIPKDPRMDLPRMDVWAHNHNHVDLEPEPSKPASPPAMPERKEESVHVKGKGTAGTPGMGSPAGEGSPAERDTPGDAPPARQPGKPTDGHGDRAPGVTGTDRPLIDIHRLLASTRTRRHDENGPATRLQQYLESALGVKLTASQTAQIQKPVLIAGDGGRLVDYPSPADLYDTNEEFPSFVEEKVTWAKRSGQQAGKPRSAWRNMAVAAMLDYGKERWGWLAQEGGAHGNNGRGSGGDAGNGRVQTSQRTIASTVVPDEWPDWGESEN